MLHWYDYFTINIYFFGLTTLAQTNGLVSPLLVQKFVGETAKASYFGMLRLWTLMAALLAQAAFGIISDQSRIRWGRRRPFVLLGTILTVISLMIIIFSTNLVGIKGYWIFFFLVILMQISANIAQGAQQGLIPDLVPETLRGRFSGIKAIFEIPLPLLLVSLVIARFISQGNLGVGISITAIVLFSSMFITMFVKEQYLLHRVSSFEWKPFMRLMVMTAYFTLCILGFGAFIKLLGSYLSGYQNIFVMFVVAGLLGLSVMIAMILLGVWGSLRISLGPTSPAQANYMWWIINRLSYLTATTNLSSFAIYFLQARLGYYQEEAAQPASILMLIVGLCILASSPLGGWLSDYVGQKKIVSISGVIAFLGTLLVLFKPYLSLIYIGGAIIGSATGMFYAANWGLGTKLVPQGEAGKYLGIANLAGAGAGAVGAYLGGPIADFFTLRLPMSPDIGYILLFSIYGLLFLFSIFSLAQIKNYKISIQSLKLKS